MPLLLFAVATLVGLGFAYVDSRPNFDDTGLLAFAIAIACAVFGFVAPRRAWLWALAVGGWIPLASILRGGPAGSVLALAFALAGAYFGAGCRKLYASAT